MSRQFFLFLLTGGFAAVVNLGCRYLLNSVMQFDAAVPIAYLFGMVTAYSLARLCVFDETGRSRLDEFRRFALVNVVALGVVWAISVGLAEWFFPLIGFSWHAQDVAHVIGVLSPAVISYFGHQSYTFAKL